MLFIWIILLCIRVTCVHFHSYLEQNFQCWTTAATTTTTTHIARSLFYSLDGATSYNDLSLEGECKVSYDHKIAFHTNVSVIHDDAFIPIHTLVSYTTNCSQFHTNQPVLINLLSGSIPQMQWQLSTHCVLIRLFLETALKSKNQPLLVQKQTFKRWAASSLIVKAHAVNPSGI